MRNPIPVKARQPIPLSEVTASDIKEAIRLFNRFGREKFLELYGYKPSHTFRLKVGKRLYDSKAIIGVAAGLEASDFSGGTSRLLPVCRRCGYQLFNVKTGEEY
jgi:5-methylcytosine-specific restriction protein A